MIASRVSLGFVVLVAAGCGGLALPSNYPPPLTKYQGRTAAEWGPKALDADLNTCREASQALQSLGAEGIPFLIAALKQNQKNAALGILPYVQGNLVATGDLPTVAAYLDENSVARFYALGILKDAGPKSKQWLPKIKEMYAAEKVKLKDAEDAFRKTTKGQADFQQQKHRVDSERSFCSQFEAAVEAIDK